MNNAELLETYLAERDETCPLCGYQLRGLTSHACPECGSELRLRVSLEHPRLAAYITGMAGLATAAGANLLVFGLFIAAVLVLGPPNTNLALMSITLTVGLIVGSVLLFVWLKAGRRLRLTSDRRLRVLVIACWSVPTLNLVIWIALLVMVN